ncbi:di-heme oxidoredictase family protein [Acaryochloris sp. IP29b_bin.148]|uniref:di-heme oxidoreductase family protein n=1 Tax=Acaryochloris sp. IP29b_bin.148 TaxID=2969218 RepID=UPI00262F7D00|nr:di-heme oxidoredictase family protein [Acaryochloris sp. IP29b_bin.148]
MKLKRLFLILWAVFTALMVLVVQGGGLSQDAFSPKNRTELSGGAAATVRKATKTAFAQPIKNLDRQRRRIFVFGDHLFNTQWVQAPSSVATLDGLGPLFNRNSCAGCHIRDGRGRPPLPHEDRMLSKLIRLSIPGQTEEGGPQPHPLYGGQLQEQGILGVAPEGHTQITWTEEPGTFADGQSFSVRSPSYAFQDLAYGPFGDEVLFSPRVAPAVFGWGLLENVPQADILQRADPEDQDGDGISGRPNYVWDIAQQTKQLGRLGWKANQPNLKQQIAGAFNGDIGLTTSLFPDPSCNQGQADCLKETQFGEQPEVSDEFLEKITIYMRLLAVPARRNIEGASEQHGEQLFYQAQCASCHTPRMVTGKASEHPEFNNQVIHPYTDLLLHDMGPGLVDHRPDFEAEGQEWRTPPLWGIGLVDTVNKHTFYLHDGRARNLMEAILWHEGEAQQSKEAVAQMPAADRTDLITFLNSL